MRVCPACGEENSDRARFCQACAGPLQGAPAVLEERKLVTVLFADVEGSTALGERLDPERLRRVMEAYFATVRREIEAEGGTVEKFIGDAVVAVFGVPVAHDDDAARALRAAQRMVAAIQALNADLERGHGVALRIRVGVNTGEVLTMAGARPGEPIATGDVLNLASRLQELADPMGVLAAERTARAARGFTFSDAGGLSIRGRGEPVRALRLVAAPEHDARGVPGMRVPMVGRERELGMLVALLDRVAAEGRPHVVTVYGDAGVGKSRLVGELLHRAAASGQPPVVVRGRCLAYGDGVAYWPLAEILKEQAGVLDSDTPEVARARILALRDSVLTSEVTADPERTAAVLAHTVGLEDPALAGESPRQVRAHIHAGWRAFFSGLAQHSPVIAVVEDVHWADPALLDVLEDLAAKVAAPLLIICTARPELTARRPAWGGGGRETSSVLLHPLSGEQAETLVGLLLEVDDLPESLRARIVERAEGNPFFVEEIVRRLLDEGRIQRRDGRWHAAPGIDGVEIPDTVQAVLAARIDLLGAQPKRVLQLAAVVGRVFWTGAVRALLDDAETADDTAMDDVLDVLEERQLVSSRLTSSVAGQRELSFKHILTRDVAYGSLTRRDRARAHARLADWMEASAGDRRGEIVDLLAHHWAEAHAGAGEAGVDDAELERLRARAHAAAVDAAHQAVGSMAVERARNNADRALALAASGRERAAAHALLGAIALHAYTGDLVIEHYRAAAGAMPRETALDRLLVAEYLAHALEVAVRHTGILRIGMPPEETERLLAEAVEHAGTADSEALSLLLGVSAVWQVRRAAADDAAAVAAATETAERAVAMALRLDRPVLASQALDSLSAAVVLRGDYRKLNEVTARRRALLPRIDDPWEVVDIVNMEAWGAMGLGRYAEVVEHCDSLARLLPEDAAAHAEDLLPWRVIAQVRLGEWDAALRDHARTIANMGDRVENPTPWMSRHFAAAAFVYDSRGDRDEAERLLSIFERVRSDRSLTLGPLAGGGHFVALLLARWGRFAEARARVRWGKLGGAFSGIDLEAFGLVVAEEGAWDDAADVVTRLRHAAEQLDLPLSGAAADCLEGRWALAHGDAVGAVGLLRRALAAYRDAGCRWDALAVETALAEALSAAGDAGAAQAALQSARSAAAALGSVVDARRCDDVAARLGVGPVRGRG